MISDRVCLLPAVRLSALALGIPGCAAQPATERRPRTEARHAAIADTIRTLIGETARAFDSPDCDDIAEISNLPDDGRFVLAAEDRIIRFESIDQMVAMCLRIKQDRLSGGGGDPGADGPCG